VKDKDCLNVQILEISPIFEAISVDFLNNLGMLRQRETERATKSCTRALIRMKKVLLYYIRFSKTNVAQLKINKVATVFRHS
jgi:hypothetical protein